MKQRRIGRSLAEFSHKLYDVQFGPRDGEKVLLDSTGGLVRRFYATPGRLVLTNERVIFLPYNRWPLRSFIWKKKSVEVELMDVVSVAESGRILLAPQPCSKTFRLNLRNKQLAFSAPRCSEWVTEISRALRET